MPRRGGGAAGGDPAYDRGGPATPLIPLCRVAGGRQRPGRGRGRPLGGLLTLLLLLLPVAVAGHELGGRLEKGEVGGRRRAVHVHRHGHRAAPSAVLRREVPEETPQAALDARERGRAGGTRTYPALPEEDGQGGECLWGQRHRHGLDVRVLRGRPGQEAAELLAALLRDEDALRRGDAAAV